MLAPPTRASGAGLAQHAARHCAFAATTYGVEEAPGAGYPELCGRVRTAWGSPDVAKTFSNASGSEHSAMVGSLWQGRNG